LPFKKKSEIKIYQLKLFDSLVELIILYGSEVLGF